MIKEIKYFAYLLTIILFFFFIIYHYVSDSNQKKFYRTINNQNNLIDTYSNKLFIFENDTNNIIEYINKNNLKSKKKYKFWNLIDND